MGRTGCSHSPNTTYAAALQRGAPRAPRITRSCFPGTEGRQSMSPELPSASTRGSSDDRIPTDPTDEGQGGSTLWTYVTLPSCFAESRPLPLRLTDPGTGFVTCRPVSRGDLVWNRFYEMPTVGLMSVDGMRERGSSLLRAPGHILGRPSEGRPTRGAARRKAP